MTETRRKGKGNTMKGKRFLGVCLAACCAAVSSAETPKTLELPPSSWSSIAKTEEGTMTAEFKPAAELRCSLPSLKDYNTFSFDMRLRGNDNMGLIMYGPDGVRAIIDAASLSGLRVLPENEWVHIVWNFRRDPGWVTPPRSDGFPFDFAKALGIFGDANKTGTPYTAEFKNLRFEKTPDVKPQSEIEIEKFIANHKPGILKGKKLILWGQDVDGSISNIPEYNKYAIDGIFIDIGTRLPGGPAFRDNFFTPAPLDEKFLAAAVEKLRKADWGHVRDNFMRIDIAGMNASCFNNPDGSTRALDWFDDDLFDKHIFPKVTTFAKYIKTTEFHFIFDNEAYSTEPYDYFAIYKKTGRSFAEYEAKVRQRGREFAEAVEKGYPGAKMIILYCNWAAGTKRDQTRYGLLAAFIDGMCESKTTLRLIDGYEGGYEFSDRNSVLRGLYHVTETARQFSLVPDIYAKRMEAGFGIWIRPNVMSAAKFADIAKNSLMESDGYIWLYTEGLTGVDDPGFKDFMKAITEMRSESEKAAAVK